MSSSPVVNDQKIALAKPWFRSALSELKVVQQLSLNSEGLYPQIVFHCHQAVDYMLKSFLVFHERDFSKDQSLLESLALIEKVDSLTAQSLQEAATTLNLFNVAFLDPETIEAELTFEQTQAAINFAISSFDVIASVVPVHSSWNEQK